MHACDAQERLLASGIPLTGVLQTGLWKSWKCALRSCENLCLGIIQPGFSHPGQTFVRSRESPVSKTPVKGTPGIKGCSLIDPCYNMNSSSSSNNSSNNNSNSTSSSSSSSSRSSSSSSSRARGGPAAGAAALHSAKYLPLAAWTAGCVWELLS